MQYLPWLRWLLRFLTRYLWPWPYVLVHLSPLPFQTQYQRQCQFSPRLPYLSRNLFLWLSPYQSSFLWQHLCLILYWLLYLYGWEHR